MADQESTGLLYGTPSYEANNRWGYGPKSKSKKSMKCFIIAAVIVLLLVGSNLLMYYLAVGFYRFDEISIASQATGEVTSQSPLTAALENAVIINDATTLTPTTKHHKVDNCKGTETIPTFPNIEYSFYGYNILKGYPISDGVDPGFTRPIFDADFSSQQKTADCRYIIPGGLSAVPDEACSTDYTSHTLNTSEEYDHSLSIKASASGGFFGFKFSASFDHESTEQTIKSGEYKLIHSTAQCSTYSSSLSLYSLPPLSKDIQTWLKRLNEVFTEFDGNQDSVVFEFLDYFGTHIPSKLIYGATHTYVNKLTTSSYKALSSSSTSVNAQASYASFFSIGGGATDSNKQIVSKFQSMSETITKTLGPPPPREGDTAAWAEAVQASPVPIQYELTEIQNIFTFDVMKTYMTKETVDKIRNKLSEIGHKYCDHVSVLSPNVKCADLPQVFPKLFLPSMVPDESYYKQHWLAESTTEEKECYAKCEVLETCIIATSFIDIVCVMAGVKDTEWDIDSISLVSSVRPESDLIGTRLFQNHFKRNFRLNGFQYDLSAQRCRKFKILDYYPVEYSRLSNTCGDFCRQMDGCRAFEVSNGTNYVYNCVLYSELGSSFTTVAPYDFETTFLALSPEVNSLKSNSIDFEINQVDVSGMFVVQPGCLSDECCRHTCQTDPLCLVSAFNLSASNQDCKHMYSGQSVFSVSSSLSSVSSSLSITVFPERVKANSMLQMTGLNFEKRMSDFSDVFSADECASICAAYAGCTAASWVGKAESCALHNNESLRASSQIPVRDAVLLFPAVSDGMKACQVDMSES